MPIRDTREKHLQYMKDYYQKNKEKAILRSRKWYADNKGIAKERNLAYERSWRSKQSPKVIFSILKANSRTKKREFPLKQDAFITWYTDALKECAYCSVSEQMIQKHGYPRFDIDRKDSALPYMLSNITLACRICNKVKSNVLTEAEMKIIGKRVISLKWI